MTVDPVDLFNSIEAKLRPRPLTFTGKCHLGSSQYNVENPQIFSRPLFLWDQEHSSPRVSDLVRSRLHGHNVTAEATPIAGPNSLERRDQLAHRRLHRMNWGILRIWEHQIEENRLSFAKRVIDF